MVDKKEDAAKEAKRAHEEATRSAVLKKTLAKKHKVKKKKVRRGSYYEGESHLELKNMWLKADRDIPRFSDRVRTTRPAMGKIAVARICGADSTADLTGADPDPGPGHYDYWGYGGSESPIQRAVRSKGKATFSYTSRVQRSIEDQIAPDVIATPGAGTYYPLPSSPFAKLRLERRLEKERAAAAEAAATKKREEAEAKAREARPFSSIKGQKDEAKETKAAAARSPPPPWRPFSRAGKVTVRSSRRPETIARVAQARRDFDTFEPTFQRPASASTLATRSSASSAGGDLHKMMMRFDTDGDGNIDAAELARGLEHLRRKAMQPVVEEATTLRLPEESPKFKRFLRTRARSGRRRRAAARAQHEATLAMTCPSSLLSRSMYMDPEGVAAVWGPEAHVHGGVHGGVHGRVSPKPSQSSLRSGGSGGGVYCFKPTARKAVSIVTPRTGGQRVQQRIVAAALSPTPDGLLDAEPKSYLVNPEAPKENADVEAIFKEIRDRLQGKLKRVIDLFRDIDDDNSGCITKKELGMGLKQIGYALPKEKLARIFNYLDVDGQGTIEYKELHTYLNPTLDADEKRAKAKKARRRRRRDEEAAVAALTTPRGAGARAGPPYDTPGTTSSLDSAAAAQSAFKEHLKEWLVRKKKEEQAATRARQISQLARAGSSQMVKSNSTSELAIMDRRIRAQGGVAMAPFDAPPRTLSSAKSLTSMTGKYTPLYRNKSYDLGSSGLGPDYDATKREAVVRRHDRPGRTWRHGRGRLHV